MHPNRYLSIVVAARNDNHGGDMLKRMQIFTNGVLAQADKFRLPCELIVVEWNPPAGKPPLGEALTWPENNNYCQVRFIVFPAELHNRYKHASQLPLYQMIAKNVGIRRALGQFVIATNIDILFSDELFEFMASRQLDPRRMYRCQRHDVNEEIPLELSHEEHLDYCRNNIVRTNTRYGSRDLLTGDFASCNISDEPVLNGIANLHTNACGDFTMLSREAWERLRGYPEFDMYSFHLDSLLCYMAHYAGFHETDLPQPLVTYHIEHGGGFKPKDQTLDKNLAQRKVMRMSDAELAIYGRFMNAQAEAIIFCDEDWGLSRERLPEYSPNCGTSANDRIEVPPAQPFTSPGRVHTEVTIFTIPKPFTGDAQSRQRNALRSWQLFYPDADIFLVGAAEGAATTALELGIQHHAVEETTSGSTSIANLLRIMHDTCKSGLCLYLEPDLLMSSEFDEALRGLELLDSPFVAAGQTHVVIDWAEMSFCHQALCGIVQKDAVDKGVVSVPSDPGYFVFNVLALGYIPPFTSSTPDWKRWLMERALSLGRLLIDLTPYVSLPRQLNLEECPAGDIHFNSFLAREIETSLIDATHRYTKSGLKAGSIVPALPGPGPKDFYRFFLWCIEDARIYGNSRLGLKLADKLEALLVELPEARYQLHVQRGKLLLLAVQYGLAAEEFLKAIALDPDESMPAVGLYRSMRFAAVSDQYFISETYKLNFFIPVGTELEQRRRLEPELERAAELYSQQRIMAALNVLHTCAAPGIAVPGLNLGIAVCLAQTERVKEAIPFAEAELQLQRLHPDAVRLVTALRQSVEIPVETLSRCTPHHHE